MTVSAPVAIDPLAPVVGGVYRDDLVEVRAQGSGSPARRRLAMIRTPTFDVVHAGPRVHLTHRLRPLDVDADLAGRLAAELFAPGWLRGQELLERLFTGVVLTSAARPLDAWERLYRQTLARDGGEFAPVHVFAQRLVLPGSVLELGCCFGFLALRLAAAGHEVTASDLDPGTVGLLRAVAPRLGVSIRTRVADAARYPAADGSSDTVLLVHLLEHLDAAYGDLVLAEALRLARRRVVVGVPLEDRADATWGHVRTISLADLAEWGRRSGLPHRVHEHHGGWLVLDPGLPRGGG